MVFVLALLIALFFVPSPWNVIVILLGAVAEVGEVIWGRRLAQRWRPRTGAGSIAPLQPAIGPPPPRLPNGGGAAIGVVSAGPTTTALRAAKSKW